MAVRFYRVRGASVQELKPTDFLKYLLKKALNREPLSDIVIRVSLEKLRHKARSAGSEIR